MKKLRFPMFVDLNGKRAVVVGGGNIGARRAKTLLDFGAIVTVIDPHGTALEGAIEQRREFRPEDLDGAFICVAATDSRDVNKQVGETAKKLGIPVSVADAADECDYFFPAVCVGSDLVAGVVSDGSDHHKTVRAAKAIRRVLEDI